MYIMTKGRGLTLQTDREIRYEQKIQRRKVEQQKVDTILSKFKHQSLIYWLLSLELLMMF